MENRGCFTPYDFPPCPLCYQESTPPLGLSGEPILERRVESGVYFAFCIIQSGTIGIKSGGSWHEKTLARLNCPEPVDSLVACAGAG